MHLAFIPSSSEKRLLDSRAGGLFGSPFPASAASESGKGAGGLGRSVTLGGWYAVLRNVVIL
jgi:hypothetical protein